MGFLLSGLSGNNGGFFGPDIVLADLKKASSEISDPKRYFEKVSCSIAQWIAETSSEYSSDCMSLGGCSHFGFWLAPLKTLLPLPASIMASKDGSTRPWSCLTLADGVDTLLEQANVQDEQELHLQELIKDYDFKSSMVQLCHPVFPSWHPLIIIHMAQEMECKLEEFRKTPSGPVSC